MSLKKSFIPSRGFAPVLSLARRKWLLVSASVSALTACGNGANLDAEPGTAAPVEITGKNGYVVSNLVASSASYKAKMVIPEMIDAWGIAIRPAGAGGHFWVAGGGSSWEFIGDVRNHADLALRTITVDGLTRTSVDGTQDPVTGGVVTGVAFNGAPLGSGRFVPTGQLMSDGTNAIEMDGSARFAFATDTGYISAWTDRRKDTGNILRNDGATQRVYDGTADGSSFFGLAFKSDTWDALWAVDFGIKPRIIQFDSNWAVVPTVGFLNPFVSGAEKQPKPGDYVPFNIIALGSRVFVTYAKSRPNPSNITVFYAGEEDSRSAQEERASGFQPDRGRLVEYNLSGELVRVYQDEKHLNAPWGVAIAPSNFGVFSGAVLVANFGGAGNVIAFDGTTGAFLGYLRNPDRSFVAIEGIWALQFGNGVSLGDADALYFAAGPEDEKAGLFGSIRFVPS
jgi:uncharacterized protein (TIGR03118 family)